MNWYQRVLLEAEREDLMVLFFLSLPLLILTRGIMD